MARSRTYVLNRLDRWYTDQIRRNYTHAVAREIKDRMLASAVDRGTADFVQRLSHGGFFAPEAIEQQMGSTFSKHWSSIERAQALASQTSFAPGIQEEYVQPFLDVVEKMMQLVDAVKEVADLHSPKELTDAQVRTAVFSPFGGHEPYCVFAGKALRAIDGYISHVQSRDKPSPIQEGYLHVAEGITVELNRIILRE